MNHPQQPREYDAVLGGNSPSLEGAAVLGGIEGVKLRLQNPEPQLRIAALEQSLNYGEQGLDLVIAGLNDESWDIQNAAYLILNSRTEPRIKQILQKPNQEGLKLEQIEVVTVKFGELIQRQRRIARYFVEDLSNGVILEMAAIPGGTFMMGSPENEEGRQNNESPQHQVTVPSFFIGKYPVTQAQYQAIMGANPSYFKGSNRPVECVSWNDAVAFCEKLSQKIGKTYRLPSEAEWEYACRAGTTTPFHFGEMITTDLANYDGNFTYGDGIKGIYRKETTEVGSFGVANNFGLYDMHGNVREWCQDNWHNKYKGAPTDGSVWVKNVKHTDIRLLRGGSWVTYPKDCRSVYRDSCYRPACTDLGFRIVCSGPSLEGAAILVGIERVKLRLKNPDLKVRIAALEQSLNYGEQGLDLVIAGLKDESWDIQNAAYLILNSRTEPRIKQILEKPNQEGLKLEQIEVVTVDKFGEIIQYQPRIARYFLEDLGNGVNLETAAIPGGTFMMGSPENEAKRRDSESPQHQVTVPSFFMGKYPVTQAQYQAIMGANPSRFKGSNRPVECVKWYNAVAFCEKLSQITGKTYRLPSEAEWEYACRAGTTTPFHFGETITADLANYNGNFTYGDGIKGIYRKETTEVGSFGVANNFGLYDMHGNVCEWCQDNWHSNYEGAPTDGSAWLDIEWNTTAKQVRGGSWVFNPGNCRSAYRRYYNLDYYGNDIGFRVGCSGAART
ncbi:MAG: SUMF1/EgtB/PvdO family nonheme iron enzyme [Aphanizomenon sp.]